MSASSTRELTRQWKGCLKPYRLHRNDEHVDAILEDCVKFTGLHLENDLSHSDYWSNVPLSRRVAVLLYLVDRGVVRRRPHLGKYVYELSEGALEWVAAQSALAPYRQPTEELLEAVAAEQERRRQQVPRPH